MPFASFLNLAGPDIIVVLIIIAVFGGYTGSYRYSNRFPFGSP